MRSLRISSRIRLLLMALSCKNSWVWAQEGTCGKEKELSNWIHSAVVLVWKIRRGHKRDKTMTNGGKRRDRIREKEQLLLCMAAPKPFEWRKKMKTRTARGYQAKTRVVMVTKQETSYCGGSYRLLRKSAHDDEDLSSKIAKNVILSYHPNASHLSVL